MGLTANDATLPGMTSRVLRLAMLKQHSHPHALRAGRSQAA